MQQSEASRSLHSFLWKPWVMKDALEYIYPRDMLYQDAGQELRQSLDPVRE